MTMSEIRNYRNYKKAEKFRGQGVRELQDWETAECDGDLRELLVKWHFWGSRIPRVGAIGLAPDAKYARSSGSREYDDGDIDDAACEAIDFEISEMHKKEQVALSAYAHCFARKKSATSPGISKDELYRTYIEAKNKLLERLKLRGLI